MMYSAFKLNKQGDSIQTWRTPFPILNQSVPCPVLTVASWPAYRFLRRQVRWSGIPIKGVYCGLLNSVGSDHRGSRRKTPRARCSKFRSFFYDWMLDVSDSPRNRDNDPWEALSSGPSSVSCPWVLLSLSWSHRPGHKSLLLSTAWGMLRFSSPAFGIQHFPRLASRHLYILRVSASVFAHTSVCEACSKNTDFIIQNCIFS